MNMSLGYIDTFVLELIIAVFLFAAGLPKRKNWILYLLASCTCVLLAGAVFSWIDADEFWMIILRYVSYLIFVCLVLLSFCRISVRDAVYTTLCGYAVQHFASSLFILSGRSVGINPYSESENTAVEKWVLMLIIYTVVYTLFYIFLIRKLPKEETYNVDLRQSAEIVFLVLPAALVISLFEKLYGTDEVGLIVCQVYAMLCSFFVLWEQYWERTSSRLKMEVLVQNQLMETRKEQYAMSQENIDIINRKCHDLKYQIELLKGNENSDERNSAIEEIAQAVQIYDTSMQTGNEVLDTVLMEKSLLCSKWGIQMTCLADGHSMEFMNPIDLYTVFGNAVDNAIEAVKKLEDGRQRIVAVSIFRKDALTILQIENYYSGELQREDGKIRTSKSDKAYHGFGLKSIQSIIRKYGGTMTIHTEDGIFILSIIFPGDNETEK